MRLHNRVCGTLIIMQASLNDILCIKKYAKDQDEVYDIMNLTLYRIFISYKIEYASNLY